MGSHNLVFGCLLAIAWAFTVARALQDIGTRRRYAQIVGTFAGAMIGLAHQFGGI